MLHKRKHCSAILAHFLSLSYLKKTRNFSFESPAFLILYICLLIFCQLAEASHIGDENHISRNSQSAVKVMGPPRGELIWADEFNGEINISKGNHIGKWRANENLKGTDVGYKSYSGDSWNINPNQHPVHSPFSVENGVLTIKAKKTPPAIIDDINAITNGKGVPKWVGGILISDPQAHTFKYGYFETRARFPSPGKGMFPAFWLYVADGRNLKDPRKSGAEIDIFEIMGHAKGSPWVATVHRRDWQGNGDTIEVGTFRTDTADWHIYGLDWQPRYLRFYRDGVLMGEIIGPEATWFDMEMGIRINFSVDGSYLKKLGNKSDETTPPIMKMEVDYVRVYKSSLISIPPFKTLCKLGKCK